MGRYRTKLQAIQEANKNILGEQNDEMDQQRKQAWELVGQDDVETGNDKGDPGDVGDDWKSIQRILWKYEKGMDDEQIKEHISNLQSHIQQLVYIINNR